MEPEQEPQEHRVPLQLVAWGEHDVPITFVNFAHVSHEGSEFVLTLGQYSKPVLIGSSERQLEQLRHYGPVPVKVVGRFGIPASRMMDIVRALSENVSTYEQQKGLAGDTDDDSD